MERAIVDYLSATSPPRSRSTARTSTPASSIPPSPRTQPAASDPGRLFPRAGSGPVGRTNGIRCLRRCGRTAPGSVSTCAAAYGPRPGRAGSPARDRRWCPPPLPGAEVQLPIGDRSREAREVGGAIPPARAVADFAVPSGYALRARECARPRQLDQLANHRERAGPGRVGRRENLGHVFEQRRRAQRAAEALGGGAVEWRTIGPAARVESRGNPRRAGACGERPSRFRPIAPPRGPRGSRDRR